MNKILETVVKKGNEEFPFSDLQQELQPELWQKEGLTVFLYRNDSLVFWSNNNVPAENYLNDELFSSPFKHYGNGWFRVISASSNKLKAVGLVLVKNDYPYQNEYLVNDFQKDFVLASTIRIDTVPGEVNIHSADGLFLFSFTDDRFVSGPPKKTFSVFIFWLIFVLSFVILLFYVYHLFNFFNIRPLLLLMAFIFDAILFRLIILYFEIPGFLYSTDLFSPYYFATSFLSPSLGDLFINSLFLLTIAWIFYSKSAVSLLKTRRAVKYTVGVLMILFSAFLFYLLINTIKKMIIDSNIELNLNNIFNIDVYSGLGFLSMTAMIMAFFLVSSRLIGMICNSRMEIRYFVVIALLASIFLTLMFSWEVATGKGMVYPVLFFIYLLSFIYFSKLRQGFKNIIGALVYIVFFSIITTFILDIYHETKEKEARKIFAAELSSKRDPLMEYEFYKSTTMVLSDSTLINMLKAWKIEKENETNIHEYVIKNYFGNYWNNYDLLITVCEKEDVLNIQPDGFLENCYEYFYNMETSPMSESLGNGLYFINDKMASCNYIAGLDFTWNDNTKARTNVKLFIEIFQKYISETGLGYPDLLIDQKVKMISGSGDYSYAKYVKDELAYKNGDFSYNLNFQAYDDHSSSSYFIDNEGYNHYVIKTDSNNALIISKKSLTFLDLVAPFSYLFILFSLFLLVFLLGIIITGGIQKIEFNFSNQLQLSIISIIIISFFVLGMITRSNIIHLYINKNRDNLSEKTFSVLTELENKLGNEPIITEDLQTYISEILYKFSVIFYSDINLFDTRGSLIASSRPQIFNEKLLSAKINPGAYYKLSVDKSLLYIQNEKIGGQEYLSAYIPFRNNQDKIIAYLNLPYFAKQTELKKEIGDFLAAYINVYVMLIVMTIMVTILVSRVISRPLQLIREKLGGIGLGKSNDRIEWKRKDEIGSLVDEYNRMIDELARSAELLARSERESAWREMAQQVAHEIKNPLTPMKLSVQYLQKAWDEKADGWDKQLARFTSTIVEQIDSLSEIASEFSDFAKMPVANIDKVDLKEVIYSASDLYRHHGNISISINQAGKDCYVLADHKQLLRVFNNLLQNAVQAIGKKPEGMIRINLTTEGDFYCISVSDNGSGITEDQARKIFSPSFTTKSSGMGLGLAMVRSILSTINGSISFESKPGEGATFFIRIPVWQNNQDINRISSR